MHNCIMVNAQFLTNGYAVQEKYKKYQSIAVQEC